MDEILYHINRHLDTLQLEIDSAIQYCRHLRNSLYDGARSTTQYLMSLPLSNQLKLILQRFLAAVQSATRNFSTLLDQRNDVFSYISDFSRIEMPIIYPGSVGFIAGATIGIFCGLSWNAHSKPVQRMKAVVSLTYNGLDTVAYVDDVIVPRIKNPREILVQVRYTSVDVMDFKISNGYGRSVRRILDKNVNGELPVILGRDCTGVIVEIGSKVTNFDFGDEVWLVSPFWRNGTMAEYVVTTEDMVAKKPRCLNFELAASIPYAGCLAYDACLKAGIINNNFRKRVLINSGISPVGFIACQLAKLNNCHVTVTSPKGSRAVCKHVKADEVVPLIGFEVENYNCEDRFDVVLDTVVGAGCESYKKYCKPEGIVVSTVPEPISYDNDSFPLSMFNSLYLRMNFWCKKLSNNRNQWGDVNFSGEILEKLRVLADSGLLLPLVDGTYKAEDAIVALRQCQTFRDLGKTIVQIK